MAKKMVFPHPYFSSNPKWKWFILLTVLIGATMSALDVSIVNVATPTIENRFDVPMSMVEWVVMGYMLTLTVFLPFFGRLADMFGRTRMYNIGFIIFTIGSALCGISPNAYFLIFSRVLQAIGAGMLQANSVAIITQSFPKSELGRAIGIQGAVQAIAMSIGPFVSGILISLLNWRLVFYINVPIGIIGTLMALFILPASKHNLKKDTEIDFLGVILCATGLGFLVLAIDQGAKVGWTSSLIILCFLASLIILPLFIIRELKTNNPMIDLRIFKNWDFSTGNITGFLSYYVLFAVLFLMPFYLEDIMHYDAEVVGSILTPIPLAMALIAPFAGTISDKIGSRFMTTLGMIICATATFFLSFLNDNINIYFLTIIFIILGLGMGIFTPPNNSTIMLSAPEDKLGVAGGILNMMRALGLIFGVDISSMIFTTLKLNTLAQHGYFIESKAPFTIYKIAFMNSFSFVMISLLIICIIAVVLSFTKKSIKRRESTEESFESVDLL
jgi:EmrB/QacA subfamily drug resistance transporter